MIVSKFYYKSKILSKLHYIKKINVKLLDLVLDAMDSSGEQHLHLDHNIHKRRLDLNGIPIEEPKKEEFPVSSSVSLSY